MRRWQLFASMLAFGVALASPAVVHALTIIDEFDEPAGGQTIEISSAQTGDTASDTATGLLGALGGSREVTLTVEDRRFTGAANPAAVINVESS
ncbi:MAG TPA: hypothetical protein VHQ66_13475, partial [Myxococcota bacterium]|nr:hypothetical protein [Myxococcota bacterium]